MRDPCWVGLRTGRRTRSSSSVPLADAGLLAADGAGLDRSGAHVMRGAAVVDASREGDGRGFTILAERPDGGRVVRANVLIIATGARERFIPFPGWTLPGVIGGQL